jgi:hypothetical protein
MSSMNRRLATLGHSDPIPVAKFSGTPLTEYSDTTDKTLKLAPAKHVKDKYDLFSTLPIGSVIESDSPSPPNKFLAMTGQEVNIADYQALYNVIGTVGGKGNGTTTFNIPIDARTACRHLRYT